MCTDKNLKGIEAQMQQHLIATADKELNIIAKHLADAFGEEGLLIPSISLSIGLKKKGENAVSTISLENRPTGWIRFL